MKKPNIEDLKNKHDELIVQREELLKKQYEAKIDYETKMQIYNKEVIDKNKIANDILKKLGINKTIDVSNDEQMKAVRKYCEDQIVKLMEKLGDDLLKIKEEKVVDGE